MYSEIIDHIKEQLQSQVTVTAIQTGYFGDFAELDLRRPAVLLEPRKDSRAAKSTRWKDGSYNVRVWIMVEIVRDFLTSMRELEHLLDEDDPDNNKKGVAAALNAIKADPAFLELSGRSGGKQWRINGAKILEMGDIDFSINQTASTKINTAQLDLTVFLEIEK